MDTGKLPQRVSERRIESGHTLPLFDHGYVKFIEHWGNDERIIEAARMSTGGGFKGWGPKPDGSPGDEKLLRYLYENRHATPFEMAGMVIEVKAPIMVFREWHRHRTQSYNEMSARYMPLPNANYTPTIHRCLRMDSKNRQAGRAKGAGELTHEQALDWLSQLQTCYDVCEQTYQNGLALGVPKELARLPVPVGRYSVMRASANLRNWLAFLTLRMDKKAQEEIRCYATTVGLFIAELFPRTWNLFLSGHNGEDRDD